MRMSADDMQAIALAGVEALALFGWYNTRAEAIEAWLEAGGSAEAFEAWAAEHAEDLAFDE